MLIKLHHTKCQYNDSDFTCYENDLNIWFKGYFFYHSIFYTSISACKLLARLTGENLITSINEFNGIYLCIILDKSRKKLYVANDRYGFHKLFYFDNGDTLLLSDKFQAIAEQTGIKEIDRTSLHEYLHYRFVSGKYTLARDIFCIEPASLYTIDFNENAINLSRHIYWHYRQTSKNITLSAAEEEIYTCLNSIIHRFSEQPFKSKKVGINLTGGLDSRYLLGLLILNGIERSNIRAFTYGSPQSEDIRFACKVAQIAEVDHTALLFDESFTKFFDSETIDCIIKEIGAITYYFQGYAVHQYAHLYNDVDYLMTGSDGYFIGLKANRELYQLANTSELVDYLYRINSGMISSNIITRILKEDDPEVIQRLKARISSQIDSQSDPVSGYFDWTIKNRHRKYLLSVHDIISAYTTCLLPYYDYEFLDLMAGYPYEVLEKQTPYINSMFRKVFTGELENLAKIPTDQRGIFRLVHSDYMAPKKRKYTLKKLVRKIVNSYDRKYAYPIRYFFNRKKIFREVLTMIGSSESEIFNSRKLMTLISKNRHKESFVRYTLPILISIIRFEKILRRN